MARKGAGPLERATLPIHLSTLLVPMAGSVFFPRPKREFTGQRWVRIGFRTAHLIAMAFLLGGVAGGAAVGDLAWALWGTVLTGAGYMAVELFNSFVFLIQLKGLAVIAKILLLGAAGLSADGALGLLVTAIVIGGISSHMPGRFRYFSIFHWREMKE